MKTFAGYGQKALLSILSHLVFIAVSWWALQAINFEKFLRKNRVAQARLLFVIGFNCDWVIVSNFFLDYLFWSKQLPLIDQWKKRCVNIRTSCMSLKKTISRKIQ